MFKMILLLSQVWQFVGKHGYVALSISQATLKVFNLLLELLGLFLYLCRFLQAQYTARCAAAAETLYNG